MAVRLERLSRSKKVMSRYRGRSPVMGEVLPDDRPYFNEKYGTDYRQLERRTVGRSAFLTQQRASDHTGIVSVLAWKSLPPVPIHRGDIECFRTSQTLLQNELPVLHMLHDLVATDHVLSMKKEAMQSGR